jgi:hypothetical protein
MTGQAGAADDGGLLVLEAERGVADHGLAAAHDLDRQAAPPGLGGELAARATGRHGVPDLAGFGQRG